MVPAASISPRPAAERDGFFQTVGGGRAIFVPRFAGCRCAATTSSAERTRNLRLPGARQGQLSTITMSFTSGRLGFRLQGDVGHADHPCPPCSWFHRYR